MPATTSTLKPKDSAELPLSQETLRLTVDRIVVSGLELRLDEAQRFEALLMMELKHLLAEETAVSGGIQGETLRSDWGAILLETEQPADLAGLAHQVARRLALTLLTAAQKGAV